MGGGGLRGLTDASTFLFLPLGTFLARWLSRARNAEALHLRIDTRPTVCSREYSNPH